MLLCAWVPSSGHTAVSIALLGVWHLLSLWLSSQSRLSSHCVWPDSCSSRCSPSRSRVTCQCPTFQAETCSTYIPTSLLESHPLMKGSNRAGFRQYVYVHIGYGTYRAGPVQALYFPLLRADKLTVYPFPVSCRSPDIIHLTANSGAASLTGQQRCRRPWTTRSH